VNKINSLQQWGITLWIAAALAAGFAPNYNGQWLGSVVCFVGAILLGYSKLLEARINAHRE
jgi:uncharacterized membrane protein YjjP (DUF1212 family)